MSSVKIYIVELKQECKFGNNEALVLPAKFQKFNAYICTGYILADRS